MIKQCKKCKRFLSIEDFHLDSKSSDGHRSVCKSCACRRTKSNRQELIKKTAGLLDVYFDMIKRCYDPNAKGYKRYGGRGISVCEEWRMDKEKFFEWCKKNGFKKCLQLDRRDNDGNYCPENCRFVTRAENQHNTSQTKLNEKAVEYIRYAYGKGLMTQQQLANKFKVSKTRINDVCNDKSWM